MLELLGVGFGLLIQFVIIILNVFESLFIVVFDVFVEIIVSLFFVYLNFDLNYDLVMMKINIDKDKVGVYGVIMQDIGIILSIMMFDGYVNCIDLNGCFYEVILQVECKWCLNLELMNNYYVCLVNGEVVLLGSLILIDVVVEFLLLFYFNQLNLVIVGVVLLLGIVMGDVINWFENIV